MLSSTTIVPHSRHNVVGVVWTELTALHKSNKVIPLTVDDWFGLRWKEKKDQMERLNFQIQAYITENLVSGCQGRLIPSQIDMVVGILSTQGNSLKCTRGEEQIARRENILTVEFLSWFKSDKIQTQWGEAASTSRACWPRAEVKIWVIFAGFVQIVVCVCWAPHTCWRFSEVSIDVSVSLRRDERHQLCWQSTHTLSEYHLQLWKHKHEENTPFKRADLWFQWVAYKRKRKHVLINVLCRLIDCWRVLTALTRSLTKQS